jgi:ABC-2 type transport system permease protein
MEEKKLNKSDKADSRWKSWIQFLSISLVIIILSSISTLVNVRLDLTEDHRYTLSDPTHRILSSLKNDLYIQVWLDGDMPVQFKKLRRSLREILDEFRVASGNKVDYEFINPSSSSDARERNRQYESLIAKGLNPVQIQAKDEEGGASQKIIFPGMIVNYNGTEVPVNFLRNNQALSPELNLLHSEEGLEYELIQTISTISADTVYKVAFIEGHGEVSETGVADITLSLAKFFTVDRGVIGGRTGILDKYAAIIIAGPRSRYDEKDKLVIDQYIMNGGKVLWLVEEVNVNEDSLNFGETVALYRPLNLEDQLFMYGVRINPSLVMVDDPDCMLIPMKLISGGSQQQIVPVPWPYYPLLIPSPASPVTRNINRVAGKYVNYIDTVGLDPRIRKTVLLSTSSRSRIVNPPVLISLRETEQAHDERLYTRSSLPVAVLLDGRFESAFKNRLVANLVDDRNFKLKQESDDTKMIVIADGDIIKNDISRLGNNETPLALGLDRYTMQTYGNKDFLVNCLNYLVDDNDIMKLRSREIKLRLLNKTFIRENRLLIQCINLILPVLLVIAGGIIYSLIRRKMYIKPG